MQEVHEGTLKIYSCGRGGKATSSGKRKHQAAAQASADPTGSSELGLSESPTLQKKQWAFCMKHALIAGSPGKEVWLRVRKPSPARGNFQRKPEAFPATREISHLLVKGDLGGTLQHPLHILYPQLELKLGSMMSWGGPLDPVSTRPISASQIWVACNNPAITGALQPSKDPASSQALGTSDPALNSTAQSPWSMPSLHQPVSRN